MFLLGNCAGFSSFHHRKCLRASFRAKPGAGNAAGEILDGTAGETNTTILKYVEGILLIQTGFFSRKNEPFLSDGSGFLFGLAKRISLKM